MIDWPQLDELKQVLDVESDDWDGSEDSGEGPTRLTSLLQVAIAKVKQDVGAWDEYEDEPDVALQREYADPGVVHTTSVVRPEAAPTSGTSPS